MLSFICFPERKNRACPKVKRLALVLSGQLELGTLASRFFPLLLVPISTGKLLAFPASSINMCKKTKIFAAWALPSLSHKVAM